MLCYATGACASTEDPGSSMFSFSGFGTLGVVHSSEHEADFTSSVFQPNGAGHSRSWSPDVDSLIAAQVTATVTPRFSAVLQVLSEQNYDGSYRPHVEWANVKYQFTPDLSIRVGRIVLPTLLVSEYFNVGYAYPWVRPPVEVYSLVPVTNNDGADASYRMQFGTLVNTLMATVGGHEAKDTAGDRDTTRRQWEIADLLEYRAASFRIDYQETRLTIEGLDRALEPLRGFGAQGVALYDKYGSRDKPVWVLGLSALYDPGRWFVTGEWGATSLHSILGETTAWYVSGGYRVRSFTPYLTYSQVLDNSNTSDPGLNIAALPPALAGPAAGLNGELNAILASRPVQKTVSVGARWDFMRNVDVKLQFDHSRLGAGSPGFLTNLQPDYRPGGIVNLISATLDFVW